MSRSVTDPRMCFKADHYDTLAGFVRHFQLLFFYEDQTIEVTDLDTRKSFLKRCDCKNLTRDMFYVGGEVVVFGRLMKLVEYGDGLTRQLCASRDRKTLCVVSDSVFDRLGKILTTIQVEARFSVHSMVSGVITNADVQQYGVPANFLNRAAVVMVLVREDAVSKGSAISARLGRDVWLPDTEEGAERSAPLCHALYRRNNAILGAEDASTSVVVIKNHMVANGDGGDALDMLVKQGLQVNAIMQVTLSGHEADKLVNVYKGVLEDFHSVVQDLSSGAIWVVQVTGNARGSTTVIDQAREACGPFDPVIAKALRPKSIRAIYGQNRVQNAVHVSDLPGDGEFNAEYFFVDIANKEGK